MKITAIYDNGGKTIDRYTILTDDKNGMALGMDDGGTGFSQFGEAVEGSHLGHKVAFETLSAASQEHIAKRLFNEE